ncbi:MAG: abortive infection family protein [Planctomycetota bacterium]
MDFSAASPYFSTQTITALAEVVTGGSAGDSTPSIGVYRSGPKLERFFGGLNITLRIGNASRVPTVRVVLEQENKQPDGRATIIRVIEAAADPRDYLDDTAKLAAVVDYLNRRLTFDGYELRKIGQTFKVVALATNTVAAAALKEKAKALDLESVHSDFDRALTQADTDPSDAITAACSTVESVCKCILDELGKPYPTNKDIKGVVGEVAKHLNLSPGRDDLPKEWEQDIRTILSGLFNVVGGIGSLRTHAGDAHGRGKHPVPADARIARLAIHAASTVSLFYIETWQRTTARTKRL